MNAFEYFMLLEQQPLLTQVEQDIQEAIQYMFQAPVPETRHIDEFEEPPSEPTEIIPAERFEVVRGPFTLEERIESERRLTRVREQLNREQLQPHRIKYGNNGVTVFPLPNVVIKRGADGITEYHIRMTGMSFKL